jgi:hypothetical protein
MTVSDATTLGIALRWMQDKSDRLTLLYDGAEWRCSWETHGRLFTGRSKKDAWQAVRNCLVAASSLRDCLAAVDREVVKTEVLPR